jgi:hypothetical protein
LRKVVLDLSYATSMSEEVEAHLLAEREYRRLSHPKGLGAPGLVAAAVLPLFAFLPGYARDAWLFWTGQPSLSPAAFGYFTTFVALGWLLPLNVVPAFLVSIPWLRRAAMRRRLGTARPELRYGTVPTVLRLGPGAVEVASLGRRQHWPRFSCLSLLETTAQFVLLLDETVVTIPKHALDWPQRVDFRAWASAAGLAPRYVATPPRHGTVVAAGAILLAGVIAMSFRAVRLGAGG